MYPYYTEWQTTLLTYQYVVSSFLCSTNGEVNNDIVVEMKTDKANEEDGLLNKRPPAGQVRLFLKLHLEDSWPPDHTP